MMEQKMMKKKRRTNSYVFRTYCLSTYWWSVFVVLLGISTKGLGGREKTMGWLVLLGVLAASVIQDLPKAEKYVTIESDVPNMSKTAANYCKEYKRSTETFDQCMKDLGYKLK